MEIFAPGVVVRRVDGVVQFGLTPRSPGGIRWRLLHWYNPDTISWYTLPELAARAGVSVAVMGKRLKAKWNCDQLRQPAGYEHVVQAQRDGIPYKGKMLSITQVAREIGVSYTAIVARLRAGLTLETGLLAPASHAPRGPSRNGPNAHLRCDPPKKSELRDDAPKPEVAGYVNPRPDGLLPTPGTRVAIDGIDTTIRAHCARLRINHHTVITRIRRGVPLAEAFDPRRRPRSDIGVPRRKTFEAAQLAAQQQRAAHARQTRQEYRQYDAQLRAEHEDKLFAQDRARAAAAREAAERAAANKPEPALVSAHEAAAILAALPGEPEDFSWITSPTD